MQMIINAKKVCLPLQDISRREREGEPPTQCQRTEAIGQKHAIMAQTKGALEVKGNECTIKTAIVVGQIQFRW